MKKNRLLRTILMFVLAVVAIWYWRRDNNQAVSTHEDPTPVAALDDEAAAYAVPGELVVDFRDDEPHDRIAALGQKLGVTFTPASKEEVDADEIYTVESGDSTALLAKLRANPDVEAADFEFTYGLPEDALDANDEALPAREDVTLHKDFPNDPRFKDQWHLQQIHMMETWKAAQGDGVIVAVIDTGVAKVAGSQGDRVRRRLELRHRHGRTPPTITATARTSPARSRSRPTTASASPASRSTPRSCRSRCSRRAARARSRASPTASAGRPITAPRSST